MLTIALIDQKADSLDCIDGTSPLVCTDATDTSDEIRITFHDLDTKNQMTQKLKNLIAPSASLELLLQYTTSTEKISLFFDTPMAFSCIPILS